MDEMNENDDDEVTDGWNGKTMMTKWQMDRWNEWNWVMDGMENDDDEVMNWSDAMDGMKLSNDGWEMTKW